jgi:hypothetical protein
MAFRWHRVPQQRRVFSRQEINVISGVVAVAGARAFCMGRGYLTPRRSCHASVCRGTLQPRDPIGFRGGM